MSNIFNNTLRIVGDRTKIAMLPQWEEVGFFDHLPKHERNYLFAPIITNPENKLRIWGVEEDCQIESLTWFEKPENQAQLRIQFDSQDYPPLAGIKNLAKIFPDLEFLLEYNQQGELKTTVKIDANWNNNVKLSRSQIAKECAENFTNRPIPDSWIRWSERRQSKFIGNNLWKPLEFLDPETVLELIWGSTQSFVRLLLDAGVSIVEDE